LANVVEQKGRGAGHSLQKRKKQAQQHPQRRQLGSIDGGQVMIDFAVFTKLTWSF